MYFIVIISFKLIFQYFKKQISNSKVSYELYNVVNNLIIHLSAQVSLKDSLKGSVEIINDKKFRFEFEQMVYDYELYNLDINRALNNLEKKNNNYDLNVFSDILRQYDSGTNIIENLELFSETLSKKYINYLRSQTKLKLTYVSIGIVLLMINIICLVIYPIFLDISNSMNQIFS